jgi:ubiquinone/menaquinone biosynthesis C-methylase UbiE
VAEMGGFGRWIVNLANVRRSARGLRRIESVLSFPPAPALLELGAGKGGLSALLMEKYSPGRLCVTDVDPRQVAAARAYLARHFAGVPAAIEVGPANATALPFPDRTFDGVFAFYVLHHVERSHFEYVQRPKAFAEIRRVLRAGGTLAYADFSRTEEMRRDLIELGFTLRYGRRTWRGHDLAVFRAPS